MSEFIRLVSAGLVGGCCVMVMSAIVIVVLAVRSRPKPPPPAEKIDYEALWRDPDVRLLRRAHYHLPEGPHTDA